MTFTLGIAMTLITDYDTALCIVTLTFVISPDIV